jgi:hypothetical protein
MVALGLPVVPEVLHAHTKCKIPRQTYNRARLHSQLDVDSIVKAQLCGMVLHSSNVRFGCVLQHVLVPVHAFMMGVRQANDMP